MGDEALNSRLRLPGWLTRILSIFIVIGLPLVLVLINTRLMMTDAFLKMEYNVPWFPDDAYGFSKEDRLNYAPLALAYLFNNEGIEFLGEQTFADGSELYNERELKHMVDVKDVTQRIVIGGYTLLAAWGISIALLVLNKQTHAALLRSLYYGSILTGVLIIAGLLGVATSFRVLFAGFHKLLAFEGDSWIFLYSDTLIRLFPLRFWIDAFTLVLGGALAEALVIGTLARRRIKKDAL